MRTKAWRRRKQSLGAVAISRVLTGLKKTNRYGWLTEVPATVYTQRLRDLDRAFTNVLEGRGQCPRYKKKGRGHQTVRLQLDQRTIHTLWRPGEWLKAKACRKRLKRGKNAASQKCGKRNESS